MIEIVPSLPENENELVGLMKRYLQFYRKKGDEDKIRNLIRMIRDDVNHNKQFLARLNQSYVGFVTLYDNYSTLSCGRVITMNDLYVDNETRGMGIGKKLFNYALAYTKELGYEKMEWMTEPTNDRARQFYDDLGGESSEWIYYHIR